MASDTTVTKLDLGRIAFILVEALYFGDITTSRRYGVATRTIRNYRSQLNINPELASLFLHSRKEFEKDWSSRIPGAIISGVDFIARAMQEADPKDPDAINAVSNAVKTLSEVQLTKQVIDARLFASNRTDGEALSQMDALPAEIISIE